MKKKALLFVLGIAGAACAIPEPDLASDPLGKEPVPTSREEANGEAPTRTTTTAPAKTDGAASAKCPHEGPLLDVSNFDACLDGGRCVPKSFIPEKERARLATCEAGLCVPEKILANEGNLLPKTCASLAGAEGRCLSLVFPDLAAQKDLIPQDVCDANERCAPCFDPVSGKETGACSSVSCDAPKKPKTTFKECCVSGGVARGKCIPTSSIPANERDSLGVKECGSEELRCAPNEQVNQETPTACAGDTFFGDYEGVCISDCVPRDFLAEIGTSQGNCKPGFFCAPCRNPLTDEPTGAPGCR